MMPGIRDWLAENRELTKAEELFEKTKMTTNQIASRLGDDLAADRQANCHECKAANLLRKHALEIYDGGETRMRKILKTFKDEFSDGYGVTPTAVNRSIGLMRERPDPSPSGDS